MNKVEPRKYGRGDTDHSCGSGQPSRLDSLQVFRGLAALAVVYYHVGYLAQRHLGLTYNGPWSSAGSLGVDFFFVLSGFIIFWIHRNDLGNRSKIVAYATKRITRIYPLLWVVVLTKAFVALVVPALMATLEIDAMTLLASLFLIPHERVMLDVQWTLFYEVQFYLIFGTWICLGRWFACAIALIWAGAILALGPASGHVALRQLLDLRNMEFLGGCSIAFLMSRSFLPWRGAVVVTGGAVAGTLAGISLGYGHPLFWTLVFGALVAGAVSLDSSQRLNWPRWMVYIGDASYSIYLWHTSVQMLFLQVGKKWAVPFGEYGHVLLHAGGLLSVLLGLVSYRFVEKPILTWFGSRRSLRKR